MCGEGVGVQFGRTGALTLRGGGVGLRRVGVIVGCIGGSGGGGVVCGGCRGTVGVGWMGGMVGWGLLESISGWIEAPSGVMHPYLGDIGWSRGMDGGGFGVASVARKGLEIVRDRCHGAGCRCHGEVGKSISIERISWLFKRLDV